MQLKLKEEPKEWRKSVLLTIPGLALISSVLCWRHVFSATSWLASLAVLLFLAFAAVVWPRWFRGYYRVSMRVGFALSQIVARFVLLLVFLFLLTPLAFAFRLLGKDALRLKRQRAESYWVSARPRGSLERMF